MKICILILYILFNSSFVFGQLKYDYNWILGYSSNNIDTNFGGTDISFKENPINPKYKWRNYSLAQTLACISDQNGDSLLFYCNGGYIINKRDTIMKGSDKLGIGSIFNGKYNSGENTIQGSIILPNPNIPNRYFVFYDRINGVKIDTIKAAVADKIFYSDIDINNDNGNGEVIANKIVLEDTIAQPVFSGIRHENGKDWWLVLPKYLRKEFITLLIKSDTIIKYPNQKIGLATSHEINATGQIVFSPNGKSMAYYSLTNHVQLFDFDRNSGQLSNFRQYFLSDSITYLGGCCFSPDNRFLYVSNLSYLYQFDLLSSDVQTSKIEVGRWDEAVDGGLFPINIGNMIMGPDCKIYITVKGSGRYLHVINHPNLKGLDCDFIQRGIQLPTWNNGTLPNFPNFRVGTPYENYCDTITSTGTPILYFAPNVKVYPNPVQEMMKIEVLGLQSWRTGTFRLFDSMGRLVQEHQLTADSGELAINTLALPKGIYAWSVYLEGFGMQSGKVVKE